MLTLVDDGAPAPQPVLFEAVLPIRWSDLDADGRVNNVLLLRLVEEARMSWAASLALERLAPDCMPVVASTGAVFLRPVRWPAALAVSISCSYLGRSSLHLQFELRDAEDRAVLHAKAMAVWVWVDRVGGKAVAMPPVLRAVAQALG